MSDIFREVDEALQREKAEKFWKEYGPTVILSIIVLILSTAGMTAYRTWDSWRNQQETQKLVAAANDTDIAAAMEKAASETRKGHEAIALMNAAAAHAAAKDFVKAAALYDQAASDKSTPDELRDLSAILSTRAAVLVGTAPDYKALAEKLVTIAKNDKSVFQQQAKLDAALLYGDGLKDYTTALDLLTGFDADSISDSLKEKANALKHVYEFERGKTPKA